MEEYKTFDKLVKGDLVYKLNTETCLVTILHVMKNDYKLVLDVSHNQNGGCVQSFYTGKYSKFQTHYAVEYDDGCGGSDIYSSVYYSNKDECKRDIEMLFNYQKQLRTISLKRLRYGKNYVTPDYPVIKGIYTQEI